MPVFEEPMSAEEVARVLGVTPKTIAKLAELGDLPGFRVGRLWKFRPSDIQEYIEKQLRHPEDKEPK